MSEASRSPIGTIELPADSVKSLVQEALAARGYAVAEVRFGNMARSGSSVSFAEIDGFTARVDATLISRTPAPAESFALPGHCGACMANVTAGEPHADLCPNRRAPNPLAVPAGVTPVDLTLPPGVEAADVVAPKVLS